VAVVLARATVRAVRPPAGQSPPPVSPGAAARSLPPHAVAAPPPAAPHVTTHGRLILDGHFAQRIGLVAALQEIPLPGKTVQHTPHDHLVTALVNVLAGHRQLQQISRGATPLRADRTLAAAWRQHEFPDVSGVCRLLHAVDWATAEAVRGHLRRVVAPYVLGCRDRAQARDGHVVVDWDLTAKAITTDATSDPFAAYGHMEDGLGKGYQWAEAILRGIGPDGQPRPVALGGFLRPGDTHPTACIARLRELTEAAIGRPRRRPDLLALRLGAADAQVQQRQGQVRAQQARVSACDVQVAHVAAQLTVVEQRLAGRTAGQQALRARDQRAQTALHQRADRARQRVATAQQRLAATQAALAAAQQISADLRSRLARLHADNAALPTTQPAGTRIEVAMDAQFGSSEVIASLLEDGYDVTTKATSPATMRTLLARDAQGERVFGPWAAVSANAAVAECSVTAYAGCPHPLRLLGYRKELAASPARPARTAHALILTSVPQAERDAVTTVGHYHVRGGTAELLNRQAKSHLGFRGQRLRHGPGLDILGQFVFAGLNLVAWLADTVWADPPEADAAADDRPGLATLTALAHAPADVLTDPHGVVVQFHASSGWPNRSLHLGALRQPPLPGFVWPGLPINARLPLAS
jgi:hypothetical protein